jgi:hypothetical protein
VLATHLGMSAPGLHRISRSPKCSVPSMYCKGFPNALSRTSWCRNAPLANISPRARRALAILFTCSRSHRNSFWAVCRSRQGARRAGRNASIARAWRRSALGMRGILVVEAWWRTDVASVAVAHNRTESECRTHASVVPSTNPTLAALLHNIDSLYSSPMTGY